MKIDKIIILSLLFFLNIHPQVRIISEKLQNNILFLEFEIEQDNIIEFIKNEQILNKNNYSNELDIEQNFIQNYDLFIAIPQNSSPKILFNEIEKVEIGGLPQINFNVDSGNNFELSKYKMNGYLWLENSYCLHLSIKSINLNLEKRITELLKKFTIKLDFQNQIEQIIPNEKISVFASIINRNTALLFTNKSQYEIKNNDSWINYDQTYIKIGVSKDGIYRLTYENLNELGIQLSSINPKNFQFIMKGEEIPIFVKGEEDNSFDPDDFIEFAGKRNLGGKHREINQFGEPYNEYTDRYSDTTIYWLTWGNENGLRVNNIIENSLVVADTIKYYNELIHYERNNWFDFSMADLVRREMPFWYENKTWHDGNINVGTRNFTFSVSNVFPDRNYYVFSKQQSYASSITQNAHLLAISVNNLPTQDSGFVHKYQQKLLQGSYNSNTLNIGNNILRIHSYTTASNPNACIFDWYEVEYPRYLRTFNDSLLFTFPFLSTTTTPAVLQITNVNSDNIIVWKYGKNYKRFNIPRINNELHLFDTLNNIDKYSLLSENKILKPTIYYAKQFENLRSELNQADYIAITHKNLVNRVNEYSNFISTSYNIISKVIDVDNIYDEFNYGFFNPEAIRDFLMMTHNNWQQPLPKFVTLIGSATYDYHRNKTIYQNAPPVDNLVPSFGASVSDNWFVTWDTTGAYIPQMNIGRIPAKTEAEFEHYFNKHVNHLSQPFNLWNKNYMFFSGGTGNDQNQLNQLKTVNDDLINNLIKPRPIGGNVNHFYKTINPTTNFGPYTPEQIQSALDAGAVFISYIGHSGTQTWDNSITQPGQLRNKTNRNPLITDFGCSTARFGEPDITSFSQLFLLAPEGQAIAYIGNSSLGFLSTSITFPKLFYQTIVQDSILNISEAHRQAKLKLIQQYGSSNVNRLFTLTNTLIGDPIVNLPIPQKPNLSINSNSIKSNLAGLTDEQNLLEVNIIYNNFGNADLDSFYITIKAETEDSVYYLDTLRKVLPLFSDSLNLYLPIFNKPGNHKLKVELDPLNEIDEINLDDNSYTWNFYVSSTAIRSTLAYEIENSIQNSIKILNPSQKNINDSLLIQLSNDKDFSNIEETILPFGEFYTYMEELGSNNKRKWIRSKLLNSENYGVVQSFIKKDDNKYLLIDTISFAKSELNNLQFNNNNVILDSASYNIYVFSAGFNDGRSVLITLNSQNFIPENTLRGHHVVLFDENTFEFKGYHRFDLFAGGTPAITAYSDLIDSIPENYIVAIGVMDEGRVTNVNLRNKIKTLGSKYIDSLVFRGSWSIIGKKGAPIGSVPEKHSAPFQGPVEVDSTYYKRFSEGYLLTSKIGPAGIWESLNVSDSMRSNSTIQYRPIGIKRDLSVDTLNYVTVSNGVADLSSISARTYPFLKFIAEFNESSDSLSPQLSSLGVNYKSSPELGLNYQTVNVAADTIHNGDSININFKVWNVSDFDADSVNIKLELIKPDNTSRILSHFFAEEIRAFSFNEFSYEYVSNNDDGIGQFSFLVSVDTSNRYEELFKDNNVFQTSFFIKPAIVTSITEDYINLTFDGQEILNGDYVNNNPRIEAKIIVPTWFPVSDTSSTKIYISNVAIPYISFDTINYDSVNRILTIVLNPKLSEGQHTISLYTVNANGQFENTPAVERFFNITENFRIENVYNYPNPFAGETYFTFKLTQIPDELSIKIFTVAGRLIKEINKNSSELNMDFNRIYWDGRDEDGDNIANGVYFYRIITKKDGASEVITQKLAKVF